jgi:predicted P-loop ATPase
MTVNTANGHAWQSDPRVVWSDGKKHPRPFDNLHNAILALRLEPGLRNMLQFNEFSCKPMMVHPINEPASPYTPHDMTDEDIGGVQECLQSIGLKGISKANVLGAVHIVSRDVPVHPVKEYLSTLYTDQVIAIDTWLSDYAGCEDTPYTRMIGRKYIIGMVKRILFPGCQMDYMIVLEGAQGIGKSSLLRTLAGDQWFSDHIPDIGSKDTQMALSGKWLFEFAELHAFGKAESEHMKGFVTRRFERFRVPYKSMLEEIPRQCVFAGTTNREVYLKDETGNRRYWPVKVVGRIDSDGLANARDQLFAEALDLIVNQKEEPFPPAKFEREHIIPQQAKRYDEDVWQEKIVTYLIGLKSVTVGDILYPCLSVTHDRQDRRSQMRVVNILQALGWQSRRGTGGVRYYVPPGE